MRTRLTESDLARIVRRVLNEVEEVTTLTTTRSLQYYENRAYLAFAKKPAQYRIGVKGKHIVNPGDTLYDIANQYNTTVERLMELNPEIKNKNLIYIGDFIKYE